MTQVEREAKRIVERFRDYAHWDDGSANNNYNSIMCAIECVEEILKTCTVENIDFYNEVKQAIQEL